MGSSTTPLSNHSLKTGSLEELALDLSKRMDANIVYAYWGNKKLGKILGENIADDIVVLGKINQNPKAKTYRLCDEDYLVRKLLKKYGEDILNNPQFWKAIDEPDNKENREDEIFKLKFPEYELDLIRENDEQENEYLFIYNEALDNQIPYLQRWSYLVYIFAYEYINNPETLEALNEYRKILMDYTFRFGGDKIYYLDDKSSVLEGIGQGGAREMSWNEIEKFIEEKTGHLMVDVPGFIHDKKYRHEFLWKYPTEFPLSFIDDFRDLIP